ncbi:hypothetical protein FR762_23975 (plasmid) [Enterobacter sp. E76]|nr:hypothetical protein FR762_23975 [Enterobacter sp. E76]
MIRLLCSIVMLVLTFSASADISGRVVRVLDGDTVEILQASRERTRIRLAGIDAPEKNQPFGQRSRQFLTRLVAQRHVRISGDERDRYGRILGTVWLDGEDINAVMVRNGLAWAYRYRGKATEPQYAEPEAGARAVKSGLWADPAPVEPGLWRKMQKTPE